MSKWISCVLALAMVACLLLPSAMANPAPQSPSLQVQLVSDQDLMIAGGEASYHLIYHSVSNPSKTSAWIKIKVPDGFDLADAGSAEWDATARVLSWNIKDLDNHGADVVHFNLKVKAEEPKGAKLVLVGEVTPDGLATYETNEVQIIVGQDIHQPFFNGYPDGGFHPLSNLTRAETAAIVARVKQLKDDEEKTFYTDVAEDHWAASYINEVTNAGYMEGADHRFRPEEPITRAELVTLAMRMKGIQPVPVPGFADEKGHWSHDSVNTAKALKYIDGDKKGDFQPDAYITRQDAARLLDIALNRGELTDGDTKVIRHFWDVGPQDWAFGWIEESSMVAHESGYQGHFKERLTRYLPDLTNPF